MIRRQWEHVAESGNKDKVPTFCSSTVLERLLQPVECSLSACAVEDILRLFGQLIKPAFSFSQNKILGAAQTFLHVIALESCNSFVVLASIFFS